MGRAQSSEVLVRIVVDVCRGFQGHGKQYVEFALFQLHPRSRTVRTATDKTYVALYSKVRCKLATGAADLAVSFPIRCRFRSVFLSLRRSRGAVY